MPRIVCVGSMNMDIAAYGEALPRAGETVFASDLATSPGGKGLNQAVAARRLGAEVAFVGQLGRDQSGDTLARFLDREGVDTSGIGRLEGVPTGTALILVDAASQNAIVVVSGANMAWPPAWSEQLTFAAGDLAVAQFEVPDAVIVEAFTRARAAGARTILNAAPARPMPAGLLALTDILVVNETELAAAVGRPIDEADVAAVARAAETLSRTGPAVVVTLGSRGAVVLAGGEETRIEARAVKAVDTAGAGDCFIGALAAGLVRGETLVAAAGYANRAAAIAVTRKGTAVAMPFAHEL